MYQVRYDPLRHWLTDFAPFLGPVAHRIIGGTYFLNYDPETNTCMRCTTSVDDNEPTEVIFIMFTPSGVRVERENVNDLQQLLFATLLSR